ncbi:LacI family DNA-binding transcriptional regulator [Brochothrix campestris]|uniref:LacI family DNA-binding transcriptional regulator n=1 Tax=Brochothrix campestris TaxID=2757 RepID=UPI0038CF8AF9
MNIKEIAKLAGYSVTTVSRVINNHPYVADEKRRKIKAVMKEVGYVPNNTARALSIGKSKNIGIVVPYSNYPYFDKIVGGVVEAAFIQDYKVTLLPTNYNQATEEGYFKELQAKSFDGLIVTSKCNSFEVIEQYQTRGNIVCCENTDTVNLSSVSLNREVALTEALRALQRQGYERVAIAVNRNEQESATTRAMFSSYRSVFQTLPPELVYRRCSTRADGAAAIRHFNTSAIEIDALFLNDDAIAVGAYQELVRTNQTHIKLVGQGNELTSELLKMATIDHQLTMIGKEAFRLLFLNKITKTTLQSVYIERGEI